MLMVNGNNLLLKVFAVSKKVHTTRTRSLGVLTEDDTQIVRAFFKGLFAVKGENSINKQ